MDKVETPITKPLPDFWIKNKKFGKHFMTMGEWSEYLQYFLKPQKQRRKKRMSLFKEKKKHLDPLIFKFHFSSFLGCFKQFKKLWKCYLKLYKPFWSAKIIEWRPKILSSWMQSGHIHPHPHDPFHLENAYLVQTFINLNNFCCIKCTI